VLRSIREAASAANRLDMTVRMAHVALGLKDHYQTEPVRAKGKAPTALASRRSTWPDRQ